MLTCHDHPFPLLARLPQSIPSSDHLEKKTCGGFAELSDRALSSCIYIQNEDLSGVACYMVASYVIRSWRLYFAHISILPSHSSGRGLIRSRSIWILVIPASSEVEDYAPSIPAFCQVILQTGGLDQAAFSLNKRSRFHPDGQITFDSGPRRQSPTASNVIEASIMTCYPIHISSHDQKLGLIW